MELSSRMICLPVLGSKKNLIVLHICLFPLSIPLPALVHALYL